MLAHFSVLKMTSSPPSTAYPVSNELEESHGLADMALLADLATPAEVPDLAEVPELSEVELNDPYFTIDPDTAKKPSTVPCTECVELCKECREISTNCLRGMIAITKNNTLIMEESMGLREELKKMNNRIQVLQDWMMSPFRIIPLPVLQDNSLNINELHAVVSETPSDDNPWSVQLLELIDHSIAQHFPHFELPQCKYPVSPNSPVETPKETPQEPPIATPKSEAPTEDFTGESQMKPPDPDAELVVSPSPEAVPDLPSLTSMGLEEENPLEEPIVENTVATKFQREKTNLDNPILEVLDSPHMVDQVQTEHSPWQTVPSSEIANSFLPPILEPTTRKPQARREKRTSPSPTGDSDVQKKRRS